MALNKVNYVDNETIITAQNLNDIQDEIIANANANPYIGYVSDIFAVAENCICKYDGNTINSPYSAGLTGAADGICLITSVGEYASYICYPTSHLITYVAIKTPDGYFGWYNLDLEKNYPVGAIYQSTSSTSPASLFGGTWEQITDRFLLSAGSSYTAGATGGEATVALTVNQMPSHNHGHPNAGHTFSWGDRNSTLWYNAGEMVAQSATNNGLTSYQGPNNYTNYTGGSQAHNNMPPYLVVYTWKRVG